jgi:hypothetical protein
MQHCRQPLQHCLQTMQHRKLLWKNVSFPRLTPPYLAAGPDVLQQRKGMRAGLAGRCGNSSGAERMGTDGPRSAAPVAAKRPALCQRSERRDDSPRTLQRCPPRWAHGRRQRRAGGDIAATELGPPAPNPAPEGRQVRASISPQPEGAAVDGQPSGLLPPLRGFLMVGSQQLSPLRGWIPWRLSIRLLRPNPSRPCRRGPV